MLVSRCLPLAGQAWLLWSCVRVYSCWDLLTQVSEIRGHLGQSFMFTQSWNFRNRLEHHLVFSYLMKLEVERTLRSSWFFSLHLFASFTFWLKLLLRFQILHVVKFIEWGLFLDLSKLTSRGVAWTVALFSDWLGNLRRGYPSSVVICRFLVSWRDLVVFRGLWKGFLVDLVLNFSSGHSLFLSLCLKILFRLCWEETWTQPSVYRGPNWSARLGHSRWRELG